jgi:spore maturation protein A
MLGVMGLWMGLMEIATKCGLINRLTRLLNPIIKLLFPTIPEDNKAREYITSNFVANILGLGWAATPVGLKAMKELRKLNNDSEVASIDMCTFLIINISSLQLIPINIITYRSQYGSVDPSWIIGYAIVATGVSTLAGILFSIIGRYIAKHA